MERYTAQQLATMSLDQLAQIYSKTNIYRGRIEGAVKTKEQLMNRQNEAVFTGDIEDINMLLWPFFFNTPMILLKANDSKVTNISISLEAPFTMVGLSRTIFEVKDLGLPTESLRYIKPSIYFDENAHDITYMMTDSASSRDWSEAPLSIDYIGDGNNIMKFDKPYMIQPNANLTIRLNNVGSRNYYVGLSAIGYRLRVEDMKRVASLML